MDEFSASAARPNFTMKLWRGERMCLVAFDVDAPEPDLVGFAIECKPPGAKRFTQLQNRLAFSYDEPLAEAVTGARMYPSKQAPFQKFRWVHFPFEPRPGLYAYRGTKMHMPQDGVLKAGSSITLKISLDPMTYAGFVDVGFTRGFASSQAFRDRFPKHADIDAIGKTIIPSRADAGLSFAKRPGDIYRWMGFEAVDLIFAMLDEALADPTVTLDVLAYDLNEPDLVARLEQLGPRLRIVVDDSTVKSKTTGKLSGHGTPESNESEAAARLAVTAGAANVRRTHFSGLQHHKVLIASRAGVPFKVLAGSTNFSFRGLYIQSNNVLVFADPGIASLFHQAFEASFANPGGFKQLELAKKWQLAPANAASVPVHVCFSPHSSSSLPLNPVRGAIEQASSSVFYAVAFLNQIKSGPTKEAFDRLIERPIFSYGLSDKAGGLEIIKPDGSVGLVDFAFLAKNAPEPFKSEWSGGQGINVHHKFVVTDFSLPTAKVFTGSSNLAPSGESGNGDHLLMIEDPRIATAYAIEALRVFDHLHFRSTLQETTGLTAPAKRTALTLRKPRAISGKAAWFETYYVVGSQKMKDRQLFAH
jgi:phosphatidylserine/phosphatidylglycerophosphate/cardiolipin synthase-like enzyme